MCCATLECGCGAARIAFDLITDTDRKRNEQREFINPIVFGLRFYLHISQLQHLQVSVYPSHVPYFEELTLAQIDANRTSHSISPSSDRVFEVDEDNSVVCILDSMQICVHNRYTTILYIYNRAIHPIIAKVLKVEAPRCQTQVTHKFACR